MSVSRHPTTHPHGHHFTLTIRPRAHTTAGEARLPGRVFLLFLASQLSPLRQHFYSYSSLLCLGLVRVFSLIYHCWQQPAFRLTPACNTNTLSAREPTGYSKCVQTSGSKTQQTNRCSPAGDVPLLLCFLILFHSNDSNSVTNRKTACGERTSFPPRIQ